MTAQREPRARVLINTSGSLAGGAITHLHNVLPLLHREATDLEFILVGSPRIRDAIEPPEELPWIDVDVEFSNLMSRFAWENTKLPGLIAEHEADLLFHPSNIGVFRSPVPQVNLVHNVAPFVPEIIAEESIGQKIRLHLLRVLTFRSLRNAKSTIFVSDWGKRAVIEAAGREPASSPVIVFGGDHAAATEEDPSDVLERWDLPAERFILSVNHIYRYKRLLELVKAYRSLGELVDDIPLVIVGHPHDQTVMAELESEAANASGRVVFTGALDGATVVTLLRQCLVFPFTSAVENMPITLIEALHAGAAIVTSQACSMPDVCGEAALYADPPTPENYATAIGQLIGDPELRAQLSSLARARAHDFLWHRAAAATADVLRRAARD